MTKKASKSGKKAIHLRRRTSRAQIEGVAPTHNRHGSKHPTRTLVFRRKRASQNSEELEAGFLESWHQAMTGKTRPLSELLAELDDE